MKNKTRARRFVDVAWALLLATALPAQATNLTGNDLYARLTSPEAIDRVSAMHYIEGVLDLEDMYMTMEVFGAIDAKGKAQRFKMPRYCLPERVNLGQLIDVVRLDLETHPAVRHRAAAGLVRNALVSTFPCANNP